MAVLPGEARINERRGRVVESIRFRDRLGRELGSLIALQVSQCTVFGYESVQHGHQAVGGDRASRDSVHRQAITGEDVWEVDQLGLTPVSLLKELELCGPNRVGADGCHGAHLHAEPAQALPALAVGHLQALYTQQALDPLLVHAVTIAPTVLTSPPPTPARGAPWRRPRANDTVPARRRWVPAPQDARWSGDGRLFDRLRVLAPLTIHRELRLREGGRWGLEVSRGGLFKDRVVQGQIGNHPQLPFVLGLELLRAQGVVILHATELVLSAVPRRFGDPKMSADLGEVLTLAQELVTIGQLSDHLFRGMVPLHLDILLDQFWSIGTLRCAGLFQRGLRKSTFDGAASRSPNGEIFIAVSDGASRLALD